MVDNPNSCGAAPLANDLLPLLVGDKSFDLPDVDFDSDDFKIPDLGKLPVFEPAKPLSNGDLTTRVVGGDGTFDAIMDSVNVHLSKVFEKNRITGETLARSYVESMGNVLQASVQFLLGRDQAHWQAVLVQQQAILAHAQAQLAQVELINGKVTLETSKAQYYIAAVQAMNAETEYALNKLRLSTEDANYCHILEQTKQVKYTIEHLLPAQKSNLLEQIEVQRAQTMDTRIDGVTITGLLGKQKALYDQQITSFKRDAELKAAKLWSDTWNMMKSIDEGLLAPPILQNDSLQTIMTTIKVNNAL